MSNKFLSCVIKARSTQKAGLLSALNNAKITVWDVEIESNYITFTVKIKDLAKTFAILKNMCYNYSVCKRNDLKKITRSILKRAGLFVGACLAVALICFCNNVIVGVKVKTDNEDVRERILTLSSVKSSSLAMKGNVDADGLQTEICSLEGVADCAVRIVGNYLEIDVISTPPKEERVDTYSSYVAKYDATITSVVSTMGTPLVKAGDRVFAGTPLISPDAFDENGEVVMTTGVRGKVIGEVVLRKTVTVDKQRCVTVKTGKRKTYLSFSLKPQTVPSPYSMYEKTVTAKSFNLFLPVFYTKTEYVELEERLIETDVEDFARNALNDFAAESGQTGEESFYSYTDINGQYQISLYIKTITEIGIGV